jgi:hypothetical protein
MKHLEAIPRVTATAGLSPSGESAEGPAGALPYRPGLHGFSAFLLTLKELEKKRREPPPLEKTAAGGEPTSMNSQVGREVLERREREKAYVLLKHVSKPMSVSELLRVSGMPVDELASCLKLLLDSKLISASGLTSADTVELTNLGHVELNREL